MKRSLVICVVLTIALLSGCQSSTSEETPPMNSSEIDAEEILAPIPDPTPTPIPTESIIPQREDADFRNAKWGDSKETIIENESIVLAETEVGLIGEDRINEFATWVIYAIDSNNKLYKALYDFNKLDYSNAGQYIPVYNSLKDSLTEKYGEPIGDGVFNLEDEQTIALAGETRALRLGYIAYSAKWETDNTIIIIGLMSQNNTMHVTIQYEDMNYEPDINNSGL